jgi:hypothetical protein
MWLSDPVAFFIDNILYVCDFQTDQRRNSDTGSKKGDTSLAATGRKIAGKTEESSGGRLSTSYC